MSYSGVVHQFPVAAARPGGGGLLAGRGAAYAPAVTPASLLAEIPLDSGRPGFPAARRSRRIAQWRDDLRRVLDGGDQRLVVVTGPCSVHDPASGLAYARGLADQARRFPGLLIVMRTYFEKPRTVTGWNGLAGDDPRMDGTVHPADGLRSARRFLLAVADLGLPVACEWVDPLTPQYLGDLVTWGTIGARTVESPVHRRLVSGLTIPTGFKNGTSGDVQVAVDACLAAASGHRFRAAGPGGFLCDVTTSGNPDTCVVLRGGRDGPNFSRPDVDRALGLVEAAGLPRRLMVDASHGNSGKDYRRQPAVAETLAAQIADGERGIAGVMLESFLEEGRQEPGDPAGLVFGQSVTDGCLSWEQTIPVLECLASAAGARR